MNYLSVAEARSCTGLRLVLSTNVPGPWGEAAKAVLRARNVSFLPVAQQPMTPNDELRAWTGVRNAPVAILDDEPPLTGWLDILMLAERLGSGPSLLPERSADRVLCFGFSTEICGGDGFGWNRRLSIMGKAFGVETPPDALPHQREYMKAYDVSAAAVARAPARSADILQALAAQLHEQKERGSDYLVGDRLSAADIYWACFSMMVDPLPHDVNPMPDYLRPLYSDVDPQVADALDPILIDHRNRIYERHIGLPLDY